MPEYRCELFIKLKDVISDPPGAAVKNCLSQLGFEGIERLRIGREISFTLSARNLSQAKETVEKIAKLPQIGASPVMETFEYSVKRLRKTKEVSY